METKIGMKAENLLAVAQALNVFLADEYILYTKTRNAHWNVEGPDFHSKHLFFEDQYADLDDILDDMAGRIRSLGHYAPATLKDFLSLTHFSERLHGKNDATGFISELLNDHESLIVRLREKIKYFANDLQDLGTSDYITRLMEKHEKMAWMLKAHLK